MKPTPALACALLSLGCSASTSSDASTPEQPSGGCTRWTLPRGVSTGSVQVGGVARTYVLSAPQTTEGPLPLVFAFHGMGSNGKDFRGWMLGLGLERAAARPTVFVYPDALVGSDGATGWGDEGGRDVAFFDALLSKLAAGACLDQGRVFSMGFSYGGFMSTNLGCHRANVLRGVAPLSGGGPWGTCAGKVAVWMATGDQDSLLSMSVDGRNRFVANNGCSSTTTATTPSPCVAYEGCAAGVPVIWCPFSGGHEVQAWEVPALMRFFEALP